ncbi:hypothetical protein [Mesorhizobium silamurunense]|uniref:hypothetical protein n=1 Tax=Mesorhizobium silamurunense TaxID=499528 RepID=UPI001781408A|nr:hypothetical protein [Mesorhizobium silamurunense]
MNLAENSGTSIHANVTIRSGSKSSNGEDERLSDVLFFVPTDVHVATIGLMTAFDAADHGGPRMTSRDCMMQGGDDFISSKKDSVCIIALGIPQHLGQNPDTFVRASLRLIYRPGGAQQTDGAIESGQ